MPNESRGFLLMDKTAYPDVSQWQVKIVERTKNAQAIITETVLEESLINKNFKKIAKGYTNVPNTYVIVTGLNSSGNPIVLEGPNPICGFSCGPVYTEKCTWVCNGLDYAWEINLLSNEPYQPIPGYPYDPTDGLLEMQRTYDYFDAVTQVAVPYLRYFSLTQFNDIASTSAPASVVVMRNNLIEYHALTYWSVDNFKVFQFNNVVASDNIRDINNNILTGSVVGIQKVLGPWENYPPMVTPDILSYQQGDCINNINWAISQMNLWVINNTTVPTYNYLGAPALACDGLLDGGGVTISEAEGVMNCYSVFFDGNVSSPDAIEEVIISVLCNNDLANPPLSGSGTILAPNVDELTVKRIDTKMKNSLVIKNDKLFLSNGTYNGPNYLLEKGLYSFTYIFNDKSVLPIVYEVKNKMRVGKTMASMVDVTIFPVPIIKQVFTINFVSRAKLNFVYELHDFKGNVLVKKNMILLKGQNLNQVIDLIPFMDQGQLINRFIFEDGSEKTILTVKN